MFSCLLWPHLLWGNLQKTNLSTKMSDIKDTASVTLNVNGAQAKQVMADLQSKIDQTKNSIAAMK